MGMNSKRTSIVEREKKVNLALPTSGTRRVMPFNAYNIERLGNGWVLHFALLKAEDIKYDMTSCFLSDLDLHQNKDRVSQYLVQLPDTDDQPIRWKPSSQDVRSVFTVRFIQLARVANDAEISLVYFPLHAVVGSRSSQDDQIQGDVMAVLRSDLSVHKSFLLELLAAGNQ